MRIVCMIEDAKLSKTFILRKTVVVPVRKLRSAICMT